MVDAADGVTSIESSDHAGAEDKSLFKKEKHHEIFYSYGMECAIHQGEKIKGVLKTIPADFIVVEIDKTGELVTINRDCPILDPPINNQILNKQASPELSPSLEEEEEEENDDDSNPLTEKQMLELSDLSRKFEGMSDGQTSVLSEKVDLGCYDNKKVRTRIHKSVKDNFPILSTRTIHNDEGLNVGGPNGPPRSSSVCQKPPTVKALHTISPMEAARRENMHLMVQYQTALRNNPNMSIRGSQNLSLNYLRRLEENLSLARQTEKSMAMKLRQREIRLQEESQKLKVRSIDSLTAEQLREEVTQFENGKAKFNGLKQALSSDNSDNTTNLVVNLIHEVLNTTDHPLRRLFGECQYNIIQILQPVVREIERSGCNDLPKLNITQIQKDCTDPSPSSSLNEQRVSPKVLTRPHSFSVPEDITLAQVRAQVPGHFENTSPLNSPSSTGSNSNTEEIEERFEDEDFKTMPEFKTMRQDDDYDDDDDDEFETLKANQDEEGLSTTKSERGRDEDTEEEDEVIFPSLTPLSCTPLFGDKDKIQSLALKFDGLLDETVKLIHSALKKIMTSFVSIYTSLSSRDNYDICKTAIESLFFPAILPMLTSLYRCSRYNKECSVAVNMMKHVNSTPKDIAVRKKYWLNDQAMPPYLAAIEQLKSLPRLQCPSLKLDCLVTLSKVIVQTIDDYYFTGHSSFSSSSSSCSEKEINKEDISVGVDDLLPIMTYIIIRSGMPQLVTESAVLQEFVDENYLMGEEGFCLTTFDTALRYVEVMSSS